LNKPRGFYMGTSHFVIDHKNEAKNESIVTMVRDEKFCTIIGNLHNRCIIHPDSYKKIVHQLKNGSNVADAGVIQIKGGRQMQEDAYESHLSHGFSDLDEKNRERVMKDVFKELHENARHLIEKENYFMIVKDKEFCLHNPYQGAAVVCSTAFIDEKDYLQVCTASAGDAVGFLVILDKNNKVLTVKKTSPQEHNFDNLNEKKRIDDFLKHAWDRVSADLKEVFKDNPSLKNCPFRMGPHDFSKFTETPESFSNPKCKLLVEEWLILRGHEKKRKEQTKGKEQRLYYRSPSTAVYESCPNMTRAIGDFAVTTLGMTSEPEILLLSEKLEPDQRAFMMTASDGLIDGLIRDLSITKSFNPKLKEINTIEQYIKVFLNNEINNFVHSIDIAKALVQQATNGFRWTETIHGDVVLGKVKPKHGDNITVSVTEILQRNEEQRKLNQKTISITDSVGDGHGGNSISNLVAANMKLCMQDKIQQALNAKVETRSPALGATARVAAALIPDNPAAITPVIADNKPAQDQPAKPGVKLELSAKNTLLPAENPNHNPVTKNIP